MQWKLVDSILVGPIGVGSTFQDVKLTFGEPSDEFKRTPDSKEITYAFEESGLHVVVDEEGALSQLTIFSPNEVFINSIQLIEKPIDSVYSELKNFGVSVDREDAGLWCEEQKMLLVEVDGVVDGIEIYRD